MSISMIKFSNVDFINIDVDSSVKSKINYFHIIPRYKREENLFYAFPAMQNV